MDDLTTDQQQQLGHNPALNPDFVSPSLGDAVKKAEPSAFGPVMAQPVVDEAKPAAHHFEPQDDIGSISVEQAASSDAKSPTAATLNGHVVSDNIQGDRAEHEAGSGGEVRDVQGASSDTKPSTVDTEIVTSAPAAPRASIASDSHFEGAADPGTRNPYDAKEEADVGAGVDTSASSGTPFNATVQSARPSERAVDSVNESVPLPIEINGTIISGQTDLSDTAAEPSLAFAPTASETNGMDGTLTTMHPEDAVSEPHTVDLTDTVHDVSMIDVKPDQNVSLEEGKVVAPALAGLGVGSKIQDAHIQAVQQTDLTEPPAKRQRTKTSADTASPGSPDISTPATVGATVPAAVAAGKETVAGTPPDASSISMTAAQIKFAQNSIKSLKGRPESPAFQAPVNPVAMGIPQYPQIITQPMDLGTIDLKLALTAAASKGGKPTEKTKQAASWGLEPAKDIYTSVEQWERDVRLVFSNCIRFNGPDHIISTSAKALEAVFDRHMKTLPVEPAPPPPEIVVDDKKARRPSNPVPTIRRLSSDLSGRPKREIHPPPPRDLPYADEPQSSGSKKRKSGKPLTMREQQHYAKVNQDELKYCLKVIDDFLTKQSNQHFMWVFNDLPAKDLDFGPAYYQMIKRPICLNQIQGRLKRKEYADKTEFIADMKLLFHNCYTFNPPDNEVHQMGKRTESVFEEKIRGMPKAKPLSPEPEQEDEEDEEDAEAEASKLAEIRALEEKLAEMKRDAKLGGSNGGTAAVGGLGGKAGGGVGGGSKTASGGSKKKAGGNTSGETKKKKAASKPKVAGASSSNDGQPKKVKQAKKKVGGGASKGGAGSEEDDVRVVTYEQKEELARKITQLSDERLDGALQIISEDKPASANDEEEIELDIDDLSPRTLYRLYRYVVKPKKKPGPKPGTAKAAPGKGSGGKKRKNLDEEAEAARIAALQQQLDSFERANNSSTVGGGGTSSGVPIAAASTTPATGGHDDLVQSESSSGEDDSDGSESDY